jgi:hypothetical protein
MEKLIKKIGFYGVFEITEKKTIQYRVDNGKTIHVKRLKKTIYNPNYHSKIFDNLPDAVKYAKSKLLKHNTKKDKILKKLPKSLYLILMKEEKTNLTFVKVGFTTKKFIIRRFSSDYGYEGYKVEKILRRIDSQYAEELEGKIKKILCKKKQIKKYRPILQEFSGYSECYCVDNLDEIIEIFDTTVNKF